MRKIKQAFNSLVQAVKETSTEAVASVRQIVSNEVETFVEKNKTKRGLMIQITEKVPFKNTGEIVILPKGANITIENTIKKVGCGIEWDEVKVGRDFDADVSCLLVREDVTKNEAIYYGALKSKCGNVQHTGDNLTGADDAVAGVAVNEDDETIYLDLEHLPTDIIKVVFFVNIYDAKNKNQNFGTTSTMQARLYDGETAHIFMEADLMEDNATHTSMIIGEFYRRDNNWKYKNMAQGGNQTLTEFMNSYK